MMIYSFFNDYFNKVTFIAIQRHILTLDFDKINVDEDNNFDEVDPDTIIHIIILVWHIKFEKCKALKKNKERIKRWCNPKRWWNF